MTLEEKRFKILNEQFVCENCGADVPKTAQTTPRDHCPACLWSKHIDINPGDRKNPCKGMLKPVGAKVHAKKKYIIVYECEKCGKRVQAKAILNDENAVDDMDLIIELSANPLR